MNRLLKYPRQKPVPLLGSVLIVGLIGTILLLGSHAASPFAASEVENGSLSGTGANKIANDSTASGNSYVQFGTAQSGGGGGSSGFHIGLNMRNWAANDQAANAVLHPKIVRFGMGVSQNDDFEGLTGDQWFNFYAGLGATPQPMVYFTTPPNNTQVDALAAWAKTKSGLKFLEWSNESYLTGMSAADYALSAKRLGQDLAGSGIGVLVQAGDESDVGSSVWADGMYAAVPDLHNYIAGWVIHPYGPDPVTRLNRAIGYVSKYGGGNLPFYCTEDGIATDNGRVLDSNYNYPPNATYDQAATLLSQNIAALKASGHVAEIMLYQSTDQQSSGATTNPEGYFGLTKTDGSGKASLTPTAASLLANN